MPSAPSWASNGCFPLLIINVFYRRWGPCFYNRGIQPPCFIYLSLHNPESDLARQSLGALSKPWSCPRNAGFYFIPFVARPQKVYSILKRKCLLPAGANLYILIMLVAKLPHVVVLYCLRVSILILINRQTKSKCPAAKYHRGSDAHRKIIHHRGRKPLSAS